MSFVTIPVAPSANKVNFMKLGPVPVMFQILGDPYTMRIHTIKTSDNRFVKIHEKPGCPICSNADLRQKFGGPSYRFRINVLNTTPHKICPNCGAEFNMLKGNILRCPTCQADLTNVAIAPLNRVEILEKGTTVFTDINNICDMMSVSNPNFDIHNLTLMATQVGTGRETKVTFTTRGDVPVLENTQELYDLAAVGELNLTDEEVVALISGSTLQAVLAARGNSNQQDTPVDYAKSNSPAPFDFSGVPGLN